ncbi:putative DNA recombination-mediator protein A [Pseudomonas phage vB_PaeS_B8]|uniref:putative DNA recombination-mediator protein A n=1 Tax=Pseudomonas phage vB_PaeS_B8 TaxID=3022056 RepID=UPI002442E6E6|nr:putative DNA recombination-mediator protein A [Pseudomonas phage vB_PaeS_B8]WBW49003.1 putative DNA recombination-mediator protein A [Pseudomonas phage vB_PaeS_B8]
MKYYTGVGSRDTPNKEWGILRELGRKLAERGFILRSGGAKGADSAFEAGWLDYISNNRGGTTAEIYLPEPGFNQYVITETLGATILPEKELPAEWEEAKGIASQIHQAWNSVRNDGRSVLSPFARRAHTRNVFQVLGIDLNTPSKFLVCWSKTDHNGIPEGGTRTAWQLASSRGVPCFNLYRHADRDRIMAFL